MHSLRGRYAGCGDHEDGDERLFVMARFVQSCVGDVPDAKSPQPAQIFRALGAMIDLTAFPYGPLRFCPADDRVEGLCRQLEDIRSAGTLFPALAGKLYGKLMFLSSQYFGRRGRALLRAFSRRQHEHKLSRGSCDNPVDKLSRGSSEGDWDIVPIELPPRLLGDFRSYVT